MWESINWKENSKGILFAALIGLASILIAKVSPSVLNSVMWALFIGVALRNLAKIPANWESGIAFASAIAAATPTPKEGTLWAKIYSIIDWAAINVGKAKNK